MNTNMNKILRDTLGQINVQDYVIEIPIEPEFTSYRRTENPEGASQYAARYNTSGINCFYIAMDDETAQHEIRFKFDNKEPYQLEGDSIFAFDAGRFATDFSLSQALTGSQEDGGYDFCQTLANYLTETEGLTGIFYPSRQMAMQDKSGFCIALLPQTHQLIDGKLKIFKKRA
jgi:RES domain-containing protein